MGRTAATDRRGRVRPSMLGAALALRLDDGAGRGAHDVLVHTAVADALRRSASTVGGRIVDAGPPVAIGLFDSPGDAVATAIELRGSLEEDGSPGVAAAVHAGTARPGTYDRATDRTVQRTVAILDATPDGQILISGPAAEPISSLPLDLEPLGVHRLRDLEAPVELFRISDGLPADPPSPDSLEAVAHGLPVQPTSFIGRTEVVESLVDRIGATRLLTVTGPGGVGKTRLALQTAATLAGRPFEEVRFVSLADIADPARVGSGVAGALGAPGEPGLDPADQLGHLFLERQVLLVLDNCEHVLDGAAPFASRVLERCRRVRILATSRQPLTVPGEVVWNLVGLPSPSSIGTAPEDELRRSQPVRLFLDRASATDAQFEVEDVETLRTIARMCRRLDGLPLAIELAAARTRSLSLRELEVQIADRFDLLTGGPRTAPDRQQTLERTIRWSYDLLSPDQQLLFDRLGVFQGPVDAEDVVQVCGTGGLSRTTVLGVLSALVERSMVVAERDAERTTYRQLETLRSYARRRLRHRRDGHIQDAHLRWVVDFCLEAGEGLEGPDQYEWIARITNRLEDIRAAVDHAEATGQARAALIAITALYIYWYVRDCGTGVELLDRLRAQLDIAELSPATEAQVRYATGALRERLGQVEPSARDMAMAVERFEAADDLHGLSRALIALARTRWGDAEPDELEALLTRAVTIAQELGDEPTSEGHGLLFLMILADEQGDTETSTDLARRCRPPLDQASPDLRAHGREIAGYGEARAGRHEVARPLVLEAVDTYRRNRAVSCGAHVLLATARCMQLAGRPEEAARLLGASDGFRQLIDMPIPEYEHFLLDPLRDELPATLDAETFEAAHSAGLGLGFDDAMAYARELLTDETPPVVVSTRTRRFYRLLGPVAASVDDREVDLGPAKQRKVLARLLIAEGDPVTVDQLVQAVWGDDAPAKPRASLQSYVSRLRSALASSDDDDAVVSVGTRYAVDLTSSDMDLHLAERTVADAEQEGDPSLVARRCGQALQHWRGHVADDLDDLAVAVPLRRRATEVRRQLVVHRARALIELGRTTEAVALLSALTDAHPYDGEIQAVLLRALATQGRPGDALARYEDYRSLLAEELGADPSPELQELHLALLSHQPLTTDLTD